MIRFEKIYYVANAKMPTVRAHGVQLAQMAEALIQNGFRLTLVLPARKGEGKSIRDFYGLGTDIPAKKLPVLPLYNCGRIGFFLASLSFMFSYSIFLLWKRLTGEKFLIYTIDMDQFSFSAAPFLPAPVFAEVHDAKEKKSRFGRIFKKAAGILAINGIIKQKIVERFGVSPEKIIIFPNGVDLKKFSPGETKNEARKKLNLPENASLVVYAGKIHGWKGMEIIFKAAQLLPDIRFAIVGETRETIEKSFGTLPPNAEAFGERPHSEIPLWLRSADALLVLGTKQNDYSYYHTSPMKLFECMAAGTPIVGGETPAIKEIISEEDAFFYEPDNAPSLAEKIAESLANRVLAEKKARNARVKAEKYAWGKRAEAVRIFLEKRA